MKKLVLIVALVITLLMASCTEETVIRCWMDPSFSLIERNQLRIAAEAWNQITTKQFELTDDEDDECHILIVAAQSIPTAPPNCEPGVTCPDGAQTGNVLRLRYGMTTPRFLTTAKHELGHRLGLRHHSSPGIMNPYGSENDDPNFTTADIAECKRVGACY